jgi:hypothetical protein
MVYHPFPSFVVSASFGTPTPKYGFVCSNDFERAYPVKLLVNLATRRLREIGSKVKLTDVEPKRGKLANKKNIVTLGGANLDLRLKGPSVNNRLLKLIDYVNREAASR